VIAVRSEQKLKDHETTSENLKKRASFLSLASCTPTEADIWLWVYLSVRFSIRDLDKDFHQSEEDIKALQSVGQIIGEVLKKLDDERCVYHPFPLLFPLPSALFLFYCCFGTMPSEGLELTSRLSTVIVKASSGPRYVVSYRPQLPVEKVRSDMLLSSRKGC
jgi:ATP-dependent 26S proteasome regulatory subunit